MGALPQPFLQGQGLNSELCAHWTNTLLTELHPSLALYCIKNYIKNIGYVTQFICTGPK